MMKWFNSARSVILITLSLLLCTNLYSATEILTFDNDELRDRYDTLVFQFRCPKCQNQNVADSNAPIADDIRVKTYELLHQGLEDQEIIDFMVDRYTEFVIYKPQMSILTIWLWIVPLTILIAGLSVLRSLIRKPKDSEAEGISENERERLNTLLGDK